MISNRSILSTQSIEQEQEGAPAALPQCHQAGQQGARLPGQGQPPAPLGDAALQAGQRRQQQPQQVLLLGGHHPRHPQPPNTNTTTMPPALEEPTEP